MAASRARGESEAGRHRRWGAVLFLTGLVAGSPGLVFAQQLNVLATSSFSSSRANQAGNAVDLDAFDFVLDTNSNVAVSPLLSYRLGLGVAESDRRLERGSSVTTQRSTTIEPSLDVSLRGPDYALSAGGRWRQLFLDGRRTGQDAPGEVTLFTRLGWTPENLPQVSLQYEHFIEEDLQSPATQDGYEDRVRFATKYSVWKVNLDYNMNFSFSDDRLAGLERTQWQYQGSLTYADSYFADRVSLNLFYQPTYVSNTVSFAVPSIGTFPRLLSSAFSGLEPNPLTTNPICAPLSPAPQLLDGDLTTGVPLLVNQPVCATLGNTSVGFEVPTGNPVDTIRVVVNPGFDPTQASALSFRVFHSADRISWTEIGGVAQTFNQFPNRFTLAFASTADRFFKVFVAANTSLVPVQAVEIEALGPGATTAERQLTSSTLTQALNAGVTFRPFDFGSLSYYLSVSDVQQDPGNRRNSNYIQTISLAATPLPQLSTTASLTRAVNDPNQRDVLDTTNDTLLLSASSTLLPTLTGTLAFNHADAYQGDVRQTTSNGVGLNFSGQLYRDLGGYLSLGALRTKDLTAGTETTSYATTLNLNGTLTERLRATLGYTLGLTETSNQAGLGSAQSGYLNLTYALSRLVSLGANYNVAHAGSSTTFGQQYRVDWNPSPQLSIFASYTRSDLFLPSQDLTAQNFNLTARWSLSRYLDLNLAYLYFRGITGDEAHTVSGSLSFRL